MVKAEVMLVEDEPIDDLATELFEPPTGSTESADDYVLFSPREEDDFVLFDPDDEDEITVGGQTFRCRCGRSDGVQGKCPTSLRGECWMCTCCRGCRQECALDE